MNSTLHRAILSSNHQEFEEVSDNVQAASTNITPKNVIAGQTKRFWVGNGNNSAVVKSVLKQRYWWQKGAREDFADCDFIWTAWKKQNHINYLMQNQTCFFEQNGEDGPVTPMKLYNKLEQNKQLTNKKGIFVNMHKYYLAIGEDPFKVLPLTFHTKKGLKDP